jgi:hypothetical protein
LALVLFWTIGQHPPGDNPAILLVILAGVDAAITLSMQAVSPLRLWRATSFLISWLAVATYFVTFFDRQPLASTSWVFAGAWIILSAVGAVLTVLIRGRARFGPMSFYDALVTPLAIWCSLAAMTLTAGESGGAVGWPLPFWVRWTHEDSGMLIASSLECNVAIAAALGIVLVGVRHLCRSRQ